jgi:Uma2 family endonuclease
VLDDRLDPARHVVLPEMRVRAGRAVRYPDVVVVPGPVAGETKTLTDAVVAFEVLSPDTAETDRGRKRVDYAALPALRHYVLVEQDRAAVTLLTRTPEGWDEAAVADPLDLPALGLTLPFAEIYRRVDLP